MAKRHTACWDDVSGPWFRLPMAALALACAGTWPMAAEPAMSTASAPSAAPAASRTLRAPRAPSRLTGRDIGLVINTNDPYSVEVGEFYAKARRLSPEQVLRLGLPVTPTLTAEEFQALKS